MNTWWLKILGNSGWLFFDRLFRQGGAILIGIAIARHLGPQSFGELSFAIAFTVFFSAFAKLGLDTIVVREIVLHPEKSSDILSAAFALKLAGGGLAFVLAIATIHGMRPSDTDAQWFIAIMAAGIIFQAFDTADLWFQSQVQAQLTAIARGGAFVVLATLNISLILAQAPVMAFVATTAAEAVLCAIGFWIVFQRSTRQRRTHDPLTLRIKISTMMALLRESRYLIFSGIAVALYLRLDQVLLAEIEGNQSVGLYSAAIRLSEMWYVIPTVVVASATPYLTALHAESPTLYYQKLQQLLQILAGIAYLIAIPMVLLSNPLVQLLYGAAYSEAGLILAIHIWTVLFVFQGVGISAVMVIEKRTSLLFIQTLVGVLCSVALNSVLIPMYGVLGAAIAIVVAQGMANYGILPFWKETRKLFMIETRALLFLRGKK